MRAPFEYAIVRVVPRVERAEFLNVGVLFFCDARAELGARIELDETRLLALAPDVDLELVKRHLDALACICRGGDGAGPIGQLPARERWRWLVAPRSTVLQTSPPHGGVSDDLPALVERVMDRMVRPPVVRR